MTPEAIEAARRAREAREEERHAGLVVELSQGGYLMQQLMRYAENAPPELLEECRRWLKERGR